MLETVRSGSIEITSCHSEASFGEMLWRNLFYAGDGPEVRIEGSRRKDLLQSTPSSKRFANPAGAGVPSGHLLQHENDCHTRGFFEGQQPRNPKDSVIFVIGKKKDSSLESL